MSVPRLQAQKSSAKKKFALTILSRTDSDRIAIGVGRHISRSSNTDQHPEIQMTPFATDVIAEARRLHNIGRVMDSEVACIGTLQALKFSVREVVDLIFAPTAKPYDAPGGLKEILLAHPGNARTFGVSEWNEIRATI